MLDPQIKRGLLETCVLAALCRGDSYGYKIVKDMSECVVISESTLYPILRRLEASGCLTVYSVEHSGRLRKIYHITDSGRAQIIDFMQSWEDISAMYDFVREGIGNEQN